MRPSSTVLGPAPPHRRRGRATLGSRCFRAWTPILASTLTAVGATASTAIASTAKASTATTSTATTIHPSAVASSTLDPSCRCEGDREPSDPAPWSFTVLPAGFIYRSYLAGVKEPRMAVAAVHVEDDAWFMDLSVGGRVGLVRYGNGSDTDPLGWQLDFEAAGMGRLDVREDVDLHSVDLRAGFALSHRLDDVRLKLAYYHLSSHLGDEFLLRNPDFVRLNYSKDVLVLGVSYFATRAVMPYVEVGRALRVDGGAQPWELQLGVDVSPPQHGWAPFFALNGYLREEVDWSGHFVLQAGAQWRRALARRVRLGAQYLTGRSPQYSFFEQPETQLALALWYDW